MEGKHIIRVAKRASYTMIARAALQDERLSFAARGLLAYLLSKPDDWEVQVADIARQGNGAKGRPMGRDKAYSLLNELKEAGYVARHKHRNEAGQWEWTPYYVFEAPQGSPYPDLPYTVNPEILQSTDSYIGAKSQKIDPLDYGHFRASVDDRPLEDWPF